MSKFSFQRVCSFILMNMILSTLEAIPRLRCYAPRCPVAHLLGLNEALKTADMAQAGQRSGVRE